MSGKVATKRAQQLARIFCPLRADDRREPRRSPGRSWGGGVPTPPRWSLASEMPAAPPMPGQFETPGLCLHLAINHYRIAAGLPALLWSPLRLYQLAQRYDPVEADPEEDEPQYPNLVSLAAVVEAARVDGLGEAFDPWGDGDPVESPVILGRCWRLGNVEEIEEAIRFVGPVLVAFDWYDDFRDPSYGPLHGIIHTPARTTRIVTDDEGEETEEDLSSSRMVFVAYGYERKRRRLKCRTTLGPEYGRKGDVDVTYFEIARQFRRGTLDAWVVTAEGADGE